MSSYSNWEDLWTVSRPIRLVLYFVIAYNSIIVLLSSAEFLQCYGWFPLLHRPRDIVFHRFLCLFICIFLCFFVSKITRKWLYHRFAWNFQGRCGVTMRRHDSIFGQFGEMAQCWFLCQHMSILRANGWTDLHEIFRESVEWPWDDVIQFWVNSEKPRDA